MMEFGKNKNATLSEGTLTFVINLRGITDRRCVESGSTPSLPTTTTTTSGGWVIELEF
jgi:hypothetical protein